MTTKPGIGDLQRGVHAMQDAVAVTPNDGTDLPTSPTEALWIGGTGNLIVNMLGGTQATFTGVPAGTWLWLRVTRVINTGTTATSIMALY